MRWLILKSNYVIDVIEWDGVTSWQYPGSYDTMVEDPTYDIGIGDWYEAAEDIFYRPLTIPPDYPI
jgi:hypothetical protein